MVKGFTVVASVVVKALGIHQDLLQSGHSTALRIVWQIDKCALWVPKFQCIESSLLSPESITTTAAYVSNADSQD